MLHICFEQSKLSNTSTYNWDNGMELMIMEVTYKMVRFGTFEKSGNNPCNSLLSSRLHITKKHTILNPKCNCEWRVQLYHGWACEDEHYNIIGSKNSIQSSNIAVMESNIALKKIWR